MKNIKRYIKEPAGSFFLFGPRGTGKSTWLESRFKDALWVNLLEPDVHRRFVAHPERLADLLEGSPDQKTIVIDEVQKVPELLTVVHQFMEKKKGFRFVLTGSSARKLKRSGMDLLAGRAAMAFSHPFMASELGGSFVLDRVLRMGAVPLVCAAEDPAETLAAYVMLYVREEVMSEGLVRDIGGFSRFLEAISFSYVSVLEDMLLGNRLPVFSRRAKRMLIKQSKFYFSDCGVFRSVRPKGPLDRPEEMDGAALEGLVYQHLKAWIDYSAGENKLFFWRTQSGTEVDFVVYGESQFVALEVKNSRKVNRKDLRALKTFLSDYPESSVALLYRGTERLRVDGVWCLPCADFLRQLVPGRSILPG
jgi:predicted AAA+ superfamily ATPase